MTERVPVTRALEADKPKTVRASPNRKRLTERNVRTLPAKGKQYLVWDDSTGKDAAHGLAVLVSPRGVRSYRCVYYFPGSPKPHWRHLGRVGEMTLEEAREATRKARRMAREGEDPRASDPVKSGGFEEVVEDYTRHVQVGEKGNMAALQSQRVILKNTEEWEARPVATIRYGEIEKLLWLVRDGDGKQQPRPYLANRLHAHLKHFFAWAARPSGPLKASPMVGMAKPWSKEKPRERAWFKGKAADSAIKKLWRTADAIGGVGGRYLKIMLLIAKRKTALVNMRWEEIDDEWFWNAPRSMSENKRLHGVPLPTLAQRIISPRRDAGRVFDSLRPDPLMAEVQKASGISDFFWHGLRHLAETKTAELRDGDGKPTIPPHIRDLLFDHSTRRGSGAGYDHHDYKPEMRAAIEAWAGYVEGLVQPAEGVVRLR